MGLIHADIELSNAIKASVKPIAVTAMVDAATPMLRIPERIARQLELREIEKREVTASDGKRRMVPHVGPILIHFENRNSLTGALVIGESVVLGSSQLLDMDVVIAPSGETIAVNPESPNIPSAIVKETLCAIRSGHTST